MKEIRREKAKKAAWIFGGFLLSLGLLTLVGYVVETRFFNELNYSYWDYLIYLLGYGDLGCKNNLFKVIFSILGFVVLALFSSVCTVTWLEHRRNVNIDNCIVITKDKHGDFFANLGLYCKARDVYGAKVTLMINTDGESFSETTELAYIPKKKLCNAVFPIGINSVIFKHFNTSYNTDGETPKIVAIVTYSDMISGMEFTNFQKFSCDNSHDFVFCNNLSEYNEKNETNTKAITFNFYRFVYQNKFNISLQNGEIINSKIVDRVKFEIGSVFNTKFDPSIGYNDCDFQMLYIPIPETANWSVYHDMNCSLSIDLAILNDIDICVEIKKDDGKIINLKDMALLSQDKSALIVNLSDYKRSSWENIKELCFTVFYKNVRTPDKSAQFFIKECAFVLPEVE